MSEVICLNVLVSKRQFSPTWIEPHLQILEVVNLNDI